jgi:hypothetical protein
MAEVDLQIVREFFELNRFMVTTHWPQHGPQGQVDGGVQLYIQNASPLEDGAPDVLLHPAGLRRIVRAVVEVRPWHTERFYASLIESNPVLTQFAEPWTLGHAQDFFGTDDFKTILIISELPRTPDQRQQLVLKLAQTQVNHVLEFPVILKDLVERVMISGTYTGSPAMQVLQLLKRYRLFRNQQLEFTFPREAHAAGPGPRVDSDATPDPSED